MNSPLAAWLSPVIGDSQLRADLEEDLQIKRWQTRQQGWYSHGGLALWGTEPEITLESQWGTLLALGVTVVGVLTWVVLLVVWR